MSIYSIKQSKYITLGLIVLLSIIFIYSLSGIMPAILGAVVLYVLFKTLYRWFNLKLKINRGLSATLIILISFVIIVMPFVSLSWLLIDKIQFYINNPKPLLDLLKNIEEAIGTKILNPSMIQDAIKSAGNYAVDMFSSMVNAALSLMLIISVMYFILYYMLKNNEELEETLYRYLPFRVRNSQHFAVEVKNSTMSNVVGTGAIAIAQGALVGVAFWIFGVADPLFWGVVSVFLSFLPVVGSPLVWVPASIIEISSGRVGSGIGLLLFCSILVLNVDNVLRLYINKKYANTHPLITIIGIVIGIPMFGILGLVYGPLLISILLLLIRLYEGAFVESDIPEKERVVPINELQDPQKDNKG